MMELRELDMLFLLTIALVGVDNSIWNDMVVDTFRVETVLKFVLKHG
jgi:hypothetical protein